MLIGVGREPSKLLLCLPNIRVDLMQKESDPTELRFRMPA
jgi:hypothetical protein